MNSAYSNENLDDNALYQDPALFVVRPPSIGSHRKGNGLSVQSIGEPIANKQKNSESSS